MLINIPQLFVYKEAEKIPKKKQHNNMEKKEQLCA